MVTKDLGMVTAYAYAVAGGYTGTEAEFTQLMADLAVVVDDFDNFSVNVTTLPAGSSATASYADGVLSLGIPKGDKGDKGNTGDTGASAGFGTVSATVDDTIGTPSVEVTASGADTAKNFAFAFHNLKGQKGDKGDTGEVSEAELTQAFADFSENGTVANAEQLTTDIKANDQSPYLFRTSGGSVDIGDREYVNGIVGGTVAFNQMCNYENFRTNSDIPDATLTNNNDGSVTIGVPNAISSAVTVSISKNASVYYVKVPKDHKFLIYDEHPSVSGIEYRNDYNGVNLGYNTIKVQTQASGYILLALRLYNLPAGTYTLKPNIFDLTLMFGSTIADYIYSLEQATAGAGVAFFKTLFPKPYYAYNAGELMSVKGLVSHDMVGFNAWDEEWEVGGINAETGLPNTATDRIRSKNFIPVVPNTSYHFRTPSSDEDIKPFYYDGDKNLISEGSWTGYISTPTTPSNCHYIKFHTAAAYGTTYNHDICINLSWDGERDGEYEEYVKHSYPLDSDLTLRGIPKLDASNNLYYDGDVYEPDGTVTRKYGVVDLGTLSWYKLNSGVMQSEGLADEKIPTLWGEVPNIVCSKYVGVTPNEIAAASVDKSICITPQDGLAVYDSAYTNADTFKTAMNGVYLVYELATPTTESADPYTSPQIVNDFGTEEFVLASGTFPMPVGHNTDYPINLKAKLEMAPNSPSGDGDYIVRQTSGVNEYVSIANNATIQNILSRLEALEG